MWRSSTAEPSAASTASATEAPQPFVHRMPTVGRRLLAWGLEMALLSASVGVPLTLGGYLNARAENPQQPLIPVLNLAQQQTGRLLGLPRRSLPERITPLTQLLWTGALGLPLILMAAHVYGLSRRGTSGPKRWLGLQVVTLTGQVPGWRRILMREGLGRWGGPLVIAYGLWRIGGAFPQTWVLLGLGLGVLAIENLSGGFSRSRRGWHDWLAGTCVVDRETGAMVRLAAQWTGAILPPGQPGALAWVDESGGLTPVVLEPGLAPEPPHRSRLGIGWVVLALVLGGIGGGGAYHLWQRRTVNALNQELFLNLVDTLTDAGANEEARRVAVTTLGSVPDERATPLLVDLIAQAEDPQWLATLQQALVNRGPEALPDLRRLNQRLNRELSLQPNDQQRAMLVAQLQTVNRVVVQLVVLAGDRIPTLDLSGLYLGALTGGAEPFVLTLPRQSLAGINWRSTVMNRAQLQGARFYHPGPDGHPDTYDDWFADMAGADLTDGDLSGADLTLSQLAGASLLRAQLRGANLTLANLERANLERANLIQAQLRGANLTQARLIAADLTTAQLVGANLTGARLRRLIADGATLTGATLRGADALETVFTAADLRGADLRQTNLAGSNLAGANLADADLRGANLTDTDLRDVNLQGANLLGTDFTGAIFAAEKATNQDGFITSAPNLQPGDRFTGINFNQARNLDLGQLTYICAQGGIHDACDRPDDADAE
ncbi:MAG: pentapeptide repeat-containing protein [Leptolyngbya sp.]|nr:pentapeptide repeat-containing protein [Leptolyngbya sp.]